MSVWLLIKKMRRYEQDVETKRDAGLYCETLDIEIRLEVKVN